MTLADKVTQFSNDADLAHNIVHGPATGAGSTVVTEGGGVKTLAKLVADADSTAAAAEVVREGTFETAQTQRDSAFSAAQTQRTTDFGTAQAQRATDYSAAQTNLYAARDAAVAAQGGAVAAQGGAVAASNQAGLYAAAAATGAKFFDTIALGNAGVADGATFGVKAGGADGLARPTVFRRDSAGAQTLLYAAVNSAEFDPVFLRMLANAPGFALAFVDQYMRIAAGIADDGTFRAATASVGDLTFSRFITPILQAFAMNAQFTYSDAHGVALQVDQTGTTRAAKFQSPIAQIESGEIRRMGSAWLDAVYGMQGSGERVLPEISYSTSYGQSNSVLSTGQVNNAYDTVGFAPDRHSFVPITAPYSTVISGWQECLKQLLQSENGVTPAQMPYQLLATATGEGSQTIAALSKGGAYYSRILADLNDGMTDAKAAGKTFKFEAVSWAQGEADAGTPYDIYRTRLEQLVSDLSADATAITGQTEPPVFIIWQVKGAQRAASLAQLDLAKANRNVCIAMPSYFLETIGDDTHAAATIKGSFLMGAYFGLAQKRYKVDGKKFRALRPAGYFRQGNTLLARFNMPAGGSLVLDTVTCSQATNYGFQLFDSTGAAMTIASVSLAGPSEIKIVATAPIAAGARLDYALSATPSVGNEYSFRGNLRDNAGDTLTYNFAGAIAHLHNWCVVFSETIA